MSTAVSLPNICALRPLTGTCGTCSLTAAPWTGAGFPRPSSGRCFSPSWIPQQRRHLGAHYTSEKNILKLIEPLFLDELRAEFDRVKNHRKKLAEFHQRLARLKFLDPACGCGNFLVIAYRELRELELDILRVLHQDKSQLSWTLKAKFCAMSISSMASSWKNSRPRSPKPPCG